MFPQPGDRNQVIENKVKLAGELGIRVRYEDATNPINDDDDERSVLKHSMTFYTRKVILVTADQKIWFPALVDRTYKDQTRTYSEKLILRVKRFIRLCEVKSLLSDETHCDMLVFAETLKEFGDIVSGQTGRENKWKEFCIGFSFQCDPKNLQHAWVCCATPLEFSPDYECVSENCSSAPKKWRSSCQQEEQTEVEAACPEWHFTLSPTLGYTKANHKSIEFAAREWILFTRHLFDGDKEKAMELIADIKIEEDVDERTTKILKLFGFLTKQFCHWDFYVTDETHDEESARLHFQDYACAEDENCPSLSQYHVPCNPSLHRRKSHFQTSRSRHGN